ncbi:MAG: efflux RND transporter periplasmic adaptor subunit [Bacteroidota bacterium]|nr:efflux RND transporter periplasmic adaptor subunit [Bacteroidota bacterium]MDP4229444.1 efflux RND transporter periplasmic adaptor subunit [Bacteroidota bacterium]MDP4235395.1 efflux RND transporter periplasmic adaptor subunit [Bacteroidota bacterium]
MKQFLFYSIIAISMASLSSCSKTDGAGNGQKPEDIFTVRTGTVALAPMTATFKANGTLEGIREANVNSETQGRILNVSVNNGSRVGQGSALVVVDNELKAIAVQQAEAQRLTAEAALEKAKIDLGRMQELIKSSVVTKSQIELAELQVKSADASLKAAQSGESLAKRQLSDAIVKSPFPGIVAVRYVNQGELLSPGTKVATIVDDSKMKLRIGVGELDVPLIKVGDKVKVSVDAMPGQEFAGVISTISSKADMARSYTVEVEIPNNDRLLKSGMFARAEIEREAARNVPSVPATAVINNGTRTQVFAVDDKGIAHLRGVKIGTTSTDRAEIVEGLNQGETVVTFGQPQLKDGSHVKIQQ